MSEIEEIEDFEQILDNINTLDRYSVSKNDEERMFYINLMQRGRCFLKIKNENEIRFYPSKFIGYKNNSMKIYKSVKMGRIKDKPKMCGINTNSKIEKVLGKKFKQNEEIEQLYVNYIEDFKLKVFNYQRKYIDCTLIKES